ncbi:hypothetical protein WAI453_006562 [Rhynchosporium graminicola]
MKLSILALSQFVLLGSAEVIFAVGVCKPNQHAQCGLDGDHKRRCLGVKNTHPLHPVCVHTCPANKASTCTNICGAGQKGWCAKQVPHSILARGPN